MGRKGKPIRQTGRNKKGGKPEKYEWRHFTLESELSAIGLRIKEVNSAIAYFCFSELNLCRVILCEFKQSSTL
jgi:hypothetical protein